MPVSVLLVDNIEVVRHAIRQLLENYAEIEIVGEAVDFSQTVRMSNDVQPQVIVFDLHIARWTEASVVKDRLSKSKTLAISIANDAEAKDLASRYGAV